MGVVTPSQTFLLFLGAACILLTGMLVTWVGAAGAFSRNLAEADEIIAMYTKNNDGLKMDVTDSFQVILIAGIITSTGAILGCCGAFSKNKMCLSVFTLISIYFGVFFVLTGIYVMSILQTLAPIVQQEVQDTCRDDVFPGLMAELNCSMPAPPTFQAFELSSLETTNDWELRNVMDLALRERLLGYEARDDVLDDDIHLSTDSTKQRNLASSTATEPCGLMCKIRAERLLRTSHPCKLVHYMCTSVESTSVGLGRCMLESGDEPTTTWSGKDASGLMTRKDCKHFCGTDIGCTAYAFGEDKTGTQQQEDRGTRAKTCVTVSPNRPGSPGTEVGDADEKSTLAWTRHYVEPPGKEPEYEPITRTDEDTDFTCFFKATHRVVQRLLDHGRNAAVLSILLGAFLIVAFNCAFFVLMRVSSKPARHPPFYTQICCPLVFTQNEPLFTELESDTSEELEDWGSDEGLGAPMRA